MKARRQVALYAAAAVLSALAVALDATTATAAPAPLPATHLEFGLSNLDVSWMTASGIPWRYRFQYLAGGVNTANPWPKWQDPALPPGQFAVDFMNNSTRGGANYIPVFTYYELLQSLPSTGGSESARDFSNLNNASTMAAYYANFKLLMQKTGAYGRQVVVHVEPDFWGYMQQRAAGAGASVITAKVKSSGFAEVGAYADNLAGFAAALKHLRDTYAPNAVLALHASMWASGIDVASNTSASVNARGEADKTAAFLNSAGMWDAVFQDVDDHNAAWWELASCGTPPCVNQYWTHWWDPSNVKFPNFARYLAWSDELHVKTGRPQVVWQVPMGNQYFLTMNNTCGHYQDNVAPYFIAHAADLFNAGLVAVLFGPGNDCQTSYDDDQTDGTTNNGGTPTTDVLGGCNACNSHPSSVSDDDGGYLRLLVGQYYGGCQTASLSADKASPQPRGAVVTLTASSTGCDGPRYQFLLRTATGAWTVKQSFSSTATWSWDTAGYAAGTYVIRVWANEAGSWTGTYQAVADKAFTVSPVPMCKTANLSPLGGSVVVGAALKFTAHSTGCASPVYQFWLRDPAGRWRVARGFSATATWTWSTRGWARGSYRIVVWANQKGTFTSKAQAYDYSDYRLT